MIALFKAYYFRIKVSLSLRITALKKKQRKAEKTLNFYISFISILII